MKSSLDVLNSYANAFRDLVNAKVWSGSKPIRELLCLNKERDWAFLCTSMDIVGDASTAIRNFLQFGLDGPTKYQDVGERYLRLYGVLSATYIQQQAVQKLFELMNVPNPKTIKDKLNLLEIRQLRHKLASHSTDYLSGDTETKETYVPIRMEVGGYHCLYANNEITKHQGVDLGKAIEEHCRLLISVLDTVYEKAIQTLFQGQEKKLAEFREKLSDLRTERDSGIVFRISQEEKLVIHTMTEANLTSRGSQSNREKTVAKSRGSGVG
jgi:hypothetical protein